MIGNKIGISPQSGSSFLYQKAIRARQQYQKALFHDRENDSIATKESKMSSEEADPEVLGYRILLDRRIRDAPL